MSDVPQGPGWWQASDGKWYPPQGPAPKARSGCGRNVLIAAAVGLAALAGCVAIVSNAADEVDDDLRERDVQVRDDVIVSGCDVDPVTGYLTARVTVTNHSSERSNYGIDVTFETPDGRQIDTGFAAVSALEPGQSTEQDAGALTAPEGEFTCRVADVTRFTDEP